MLKPGLDARRLFHSAPGVLALTTHFYRTSPHSACESRNITPIANGCTSRVICAFLCGLPLRDEMTPTERDCNVCERILREPKNKSAEVAVGSKPSSGI